MTKVLLKVTTTKKNYNCDDVTDINSQSEDRDGTRHKYNASQK